MTTDTPTGTITVRLAVTIKVDAADWYAEYGMTPIDECVESYFTTQVMEAPAVDATDAKVTVRRQTKSTTR